MFSGSTPRKPQIFQLLTLFAVQRFSQKNAKSFKNMENIAKCAISLENLKSYEIRWKSAFGLPLSSSGPEPWRLRCLGTCAFADARICTADDYVLATALMFQAAPRRLQCASPHDDEDNSHPLYRSVRPQKHKCPNSVSSRVQAQRSSETSQRHFTIRSHTISSFQEITHILQCVRCFFNRFCIFLRQSLKSNQLEELENLRFARGTPRGNKSKELQATPGKKWKNNKKTKTK